MANKTLEHQRVMHSSHANHPSTSCAACPPGARPADSAHPATVDLAGAAALLGAHPETVRLKARAGALPGRKVGKRWIFSVAALQRYLAGEWLPPVAHHDQQEETRPCRSTSARPARTGNTSCTPLAADRRYREALAPATKRRPRNSTTG
ncbi:MULTISPECIES: helix-turn-helix domain-containing protein [Burkholderia]|nr:MULTISPECIES: helix-turn-helix domain-containing protein [Burkholderia]OXI61906.1 DNA-binding protein [Burkholderia sp. AU27893]OXI92054.1 DNA-binding protein [Burkholderia sp. AU31652]OXJ21207.1 DNA-binding protein [Burkholderia sp. AU6039]